MVGVMLKVYSDDDTIKNAPYTIECGDLLTEASLKFGKPVDTPPLYKSWMEDAGFHNVKEDIYKVLSRPNLIAEALISARSL